MRRAQWSSEGKGLEPGNKILLGLSPHLRISNHHLIPLLSLFLLSSYSILLSSTFLVQITVDSENAHLIVSLGLFCYKVCIWTKRPLCSSVWGWVSRWGHAVHCDSWVLVRRTVACTTQQVCYAWHPPLWLWRIIYMHCTICRFLEIVYLRRPNFSSFYCPLNTLKIAWMTPNHTATFRA